jgi:hypothetical protein
LVNGYNLSQKIVSLELLKDAEVEIWQCGPRTENGGADSSPNDFIAGLVVFRTNDVGFRTLALEVVLMRHGGMK